MSVEVTPPIFRCAGGGLRFINMRGQKYIRTLKMEVNWIKYQEENRYKILLNYKMTDFL